MDGQFEAANGIIPIRLRHDLTVSIWGIPLDLTAAEAAKISAVIAELSVQSSAERSLLAPLSALISNPQPEGA